MLSTAGISIKQLPNSALGERRKCKIFPKKSQRRIQPTSTEFPVSCLAVLLAPSVLWQIGIQGFGGSLMSFLYFCQPVSLIVHFCWGYRWVSMDRGKVLVSLHIPGKARSCHRKFTGSTVNFPNALRFQQRTNVKGGHRSVALLLGIE